MISSLFFKPPSASCYLRWHSPNLTSNGIRNLRYCTSAVCIVVKNEISSNTIFVNPLLSTQERKLKHFSALWQLIDGYSIDSYRSTPLAQWPCFPGPELPSLLLLIPTVVGMSLNWRNGRVHRDVWCGREKNQTRVKNRWKRPPRIGVWEASSWPRQLTTGFSATIAALSCTSLSPSWVRVNNSILPGDYESNHSLSDASCGVMGTMTLSAFIYHWD